MTDTGFASYSKDKDKAFIFTMQTSGSGNFYYITAVFKTKRGVIMAEPLFLGDRIQIQKIEWNKEGILVSYWDRLPSEPMSSKPTQLVSRLFIVKENRLLDLI